MARDLLFVVEIIPVGDERKDSLRYREVAVLGGATSSADSSSHSRDVDTDADRSGKQMQEVADLCSRFWHETIANGTQRGVIVGQSRADEPGCWD